MHLWLPLLAACSFQATPDGPPALTDDPACEVGVNEGQCAPDFELPTADGVPDRLSDHAGRRVMVIGSALW